MNAWNLTVSDERLDELNLRAKAVLLELQQVLTCTYQRKPVSEIARLLGCSRPKVIWMQHVLHLRNGKGKDGGLGAWPKEPAP